MASVMQAKLHLRMLKLQLVTCLDTSTVSCTLMSLCLLCRWEVLQQVLQLIAGCESLEDYQLLVHEGRHILNVLPGGVLKPWKGADPGVVEGRARIHPTEDLLTAVPHGSVLNSTAAGAVNE